VTTMRHLPGFSAEASVYRSQGNYCTVGAPPSANAGRQVIGPIGVPLSAFDVSNSNWSGHIRLNQAFAAGRPTSFGRQSGATPWTVSFEQQQMTGTTWPGARAQLRSAAPPRAYSPRSVPPPQAYAAYPWWAQNLSLIRFCNGAWVNIMTDKHNCGACGTDCGDNGSGNIVDNELCFCNNGSCACWERCPIDRPTACGYQCTDPSNQLTCKVVRCRDLSSDVSNCGMCGNQCGAGDVCCSGSCSNLLTDPNNCGTCGNACTVAHGWGVCVGGICKIGGCNPPWADCNGIYADGCETDLSSNSSNCGACGHACGTNQTCCHSMCVNTQSFQTDVNNCGMCGIVCPPGYNCCAGVCSNPLMDDNNCGGCGKARCTGGQHCVNGGCVCPWPKSYCNNVCVDTNWDPNNCGGCDKIVPPGWTCCSGMPKDLTNDAYNCGACGNTCPEGCSGVRASCSGRKCGQLKPIPCFLQDPFTKCLTGPLPFQAFTTSEAMTCAQQQYTGYVPICGVPAQQYSFAVYAPDSSGVCPSGEVCFTTAYALGVNSSDALTCAQKTTATNYDYGGVNSSCTEGDCK
jgi:Stigma-specific protein, Stig1